ncbi:MAG: efflux RND transporter permease subunit [Planctomycetia bacterium]|nr:efflux RND transporter permease subunit [Planctomycetia bacterium]
MNLILFALRRPISVLVVIFAIVLACAASIGKPVFDTLGLPWPEALPQGMEVDVFPSLNLPVIYVCQPYGGMDPAQMEGYLTNYYEYHFLYISGIHHVESKNIQGVALMKLFFHPGTNMAQAMAETINYVNRSQAFMPPGTVSPFVMRFDTGSVPVGYLVLSSETRTIAEIQDLALFRVRPMFASLPGVSAPPPFGGSQRTVVVTVDPQRLQSYGMSPDEVVSALARGNTISPSGNILEGDRYPIVPINSVVKDVGDLERVPIRMGADPVFLRDIGYVRDFMDAPTGYALANGRRAVYILATKRADASTLSVIAKIREAIPRMQEALPPDIKVSFQFDQSLYVTRAVTGVAFEGALGAVLVGLMILLFLRDWRSALVVVLNIPLALMVAVLALWLTGQTINVMTLGGLALAIGVLVDEATVAIENIHTHLQHGKPLAIAVRDGSAETAIPRLLAMLCVLAVFLSSIFMKGAARGMFVPLALAVGFSMFASYVLSSTFVPVMCVWLLRHRHGDAKDERVTVFERLRRGYERVLAKFVRGRLAVVSIYLAVCGTILALGAWQLGREIFPSVEARQFRLRLRAADGTHIARTERIALDALDLIAREVGKEKVDTTLGYVGTIPSSYPINAVFQWSRGPEEAILLVSFRKGSGIDVEQLKEQLRVKLPKAIPGVRFSFEPADIVNEVMSFGSPTPVEVAVSGPNFAENREYAEKIRRELATIKSLRDLQFAQSLDYPTIEINVDRERAGYASITPSDVSRAVVAATSSSRFVVPNFWADPKTGIGYQVQVEIPRPIIRSPDAVRTVDSAEDLGRLPLRQAGDDRILVRDVASIQRGKMPGQFDRYNMRRQVSLTANIVGEDLGTVSGQIAKALARAGEPPRGAQLELRGQIPPMREMQGGLTFGLAVAVVVVFLLLAANFQSLRLSLVTVSTVPAVVAGVALMLYLTGTTLNIQSFIGAIMAIGVAMANAILLVTFAEIRRRRGAVTADAAIEGAGSRLRAILMTSCAMTAGMIPMALALGEAGQQNAPLGRAVVGGLIAATFATLFILPSVFALVQGQATTASASLDPGDPGSSHYLAASAVVGPKGETP